MDSTDRACGVRASASAHTAMARSRPFFYRGQTLRVLAWRTVGADSKSVPIVLLHGFMQSAESWAAVAEVLAKDRSVYALDFIGHGESSKPIDPERYAYDDMAASVDSLLRELAHAYGRRVHVAGYSMGGRIAARLACTSRDVVASLVLESCNLGCADEAERMVARNRNEGWVSRLRLGGMGDFVSYWESLPLFETQRVLGLDVLLRPGRLNNDPVALALCLQGSGKQAMPLEGETLANLKESSLPIAYLWGASDKGCATVARRLDEAGFATKMFNTGHNVHLEAPVLYAEEVRKFLIGSDDR